MIAVFSEGLILGFSSGLFCLTACLPALLPYVLSEGEGWRKSFSILGKFLAGRASAYFLFAAVSTAIGKAFNPYLPAWLAPLAMLLTALALLSYLLCANDGRRGVKCCAPSGPFYGRVPLVLGFMTGINICPPFIAAFVRLVEMADMVSGLVFFMGFFGATSLFILPVIVPAPFINTRLKNIGRMTLFLAGVWYFMLGLKGLVGDRIL